MGGVGKALQGIGTIGGAVIGGLTAGPGGAMAGAKEGAQVGSLVGGTAGLFAGGGEGQKGNANVRTGPSDALARRLQEISQPNSAMNDSNNELKQMEAQAQQPNYMQRFKQLTG